MMKKELEILELENLINQGKLLEASFIKTKLKVLELSENIPPNSDLGKRLKKISDALLEKPEFQEAREEAEKDIITLIIGFLINMGEDKWEFIKIENGELKIFIDKTIYLITGHLINKKIEDLLEGLDRYKTDLWNKEYKERFLSNMLTLSLLTEMNNQNDMLQTFKVLKVEFYNLLDFLMNRFPPNVFAMTLVHIIEYYFYLLYKENHFDKWYKKLKELKPEIEKYAEKLRTSSLEHIITTLWDNLNNPNKGLYN
jgi:hypothetical protein